MSVGDYCVRLEALLHFFEFYKKFPDEDWVCSSFKEGLRHELQRAVVPLDIHSLPELVERCSASESID